MKGLIKVSGDTYTSLQMAEITGKRHSEILRDIRDEMSKLGEAISLSIFAQSDYVNDRGQKQPMYQMGKKGWLQMGARYDAKTRYAIIDFVEKMESALDLPQTFSEALLLAGEQAKQIEEQTLLIEQSKPKVEAYETISNSNKLSTVSQVSALFNMGRNTLYAWLKKYKYVMGSHKPYQKYIDNGLFDYKIDSANGRSFYVTLITGKGIVHLTEMINE
jgi:Rha family phage regulatory protein